MSQYVSNMLNRIKNLKSEKSNLTRVKSVNSK